MNGSRKIITVLGDRISLNRPDIIQDDLSANNRSFTRSYL